jgi:hypothetical protein
MEFIARFRGRSPVVLTAASNGSSFAASATRRALRDEWGSLSVVLSSANSHSYEKRVVPLSQYLDTMMDPQPLSRLGNETFYLFGDNNGPQWARFLAGYRRPPFAGAEFGALSFGVAGRNTGVPFHIHGAVYAEVLHGRKHWFLLPPGERPVFNPNASQLHWVVHSMPDAVNQLASRGARMLTCTLHPGEVLYIPPMWYHATLNLDDFNCFVSTFVDE